MNFSISQSSPVIMVACAKLLHERLKVAKDFKPWFKELAKKRGWKKGVSDWPVLQGGQLDYLLRLHVARNLVAAEGFKNSGKVLRRLHVLRKALVIFVKKPLA